MAKGFSLADQLFNAETVAGLGARIAAVAPGFDAGAFTAQVMARLGDLELKARIGWIAECLDARLPGDFEALAASKSRARVSMSGTARTASDVPISTASDATDIGS